MTMLMPAFELHQPKTLDEAVKLIAAFKGDFDILSGGTDLLPNYKCGLNAHKNVISLQHIAELREIRTGKGDSPQKEKGTVPFSGLEIGGGVTLIQLERDKNVPASVRDCAHHVASPLLRESGTVGGNLMQDTRCHFFNQSYFWRRTLGYCLKADGDRCHVVPNLNEGGKNVLNTKVCVATNCSDLAPMFMVLGASVLLVGPQGSRTIPLTQMYAGDGIERFAIKRGEILAKIILPASTANWRSGWKKLAPRQSIDFSVLGVAAALELAADKSVKSLRVGLGSVDVRPVMFDYGAKSDQPAPTSYLFVDPAKAPPQVAGKKLDEALINQIADHVKTCASPKLNVPMEPAYRKKMAGVLTRRLLTELAAG
ncbi:MAG: FAD binding domain-containing protein [Planctomycetes bacterium]|nr:FAD binding domain-containing protein [Planctomycetota bacterium]